MRGIADEHDATAMPPINVQPFDRAAMELLIALQSGQIVSHYSTEPGEALAKPFQPAFQAIVEAWLGHIGKTVCSTLADRAQPEKTPIAQPELNTVVVFRRTDRHQAAPYHLSAIDRQGRAECDLSDR